jgi:hypothetical protein
MYKIYSFLHDCKLIFALFIADIVTTYYVIVTGIGYEANILSVVAIKHLGLLNGLILIKTILIMWIFIARNYILSRIQEIQKWSFKNMWNKTKLGITGMYGLIVSSNATAVITNQSLLQVLQHTAGGGLFG